MFQLTGIRYNYTSEHTLSFPDWTTTQGDNWLLTGISGSGKTTLLHMLAGLRKPTQGTAIVAGTNLYILSGSKADQFRGKNIGLVLQKPHLLSVLTVEENLLLTQYMAGLPQNKQRIKEVLTILGLLDKRNSRPHQLSQGQAQRISIARAVLNRPKLILADEPTSSLDDVNCMRVLDLLETQAAACAATLVIATHDARVKKRITNHFHLDSVQMV
ncbi:ABC transporter ATP-binding protein [Xanthocytophaga agilis]|uniref:ATP-binding cassette domain-containing protein n=1 Tax=Xanthocytophaga agilis TaxID=3048010 RepID=A0AAE3R6H2_9BACT|nr:ATP-binding cassette domain-containing protein [Xanthocytophaga agilis]MDJ1502330.1 ATP-binding cassette domain-containing protein [Xanthocytophaga agilis]